MFNVVLDITVLSLLKLFFWVLKVIPDRVSYLISYLMTLLIIYSMPRFRRVAVRNLELVFPNKTPQERKRIMTDSLKELATNIYSFAKNPRLTEDSVSKFLGETGGDEVAKVMAQARSGANGKGVMIATAHFGNFELGSQLSSLVFGPSCILARGFKLQRLSRWWNGRREMFGNTVFDRKGAYKEIEKSLNDGKSVAVLFDQNIVRKHAVFVDFFGISSATTKALALAVLRTGAPLVLIVFVRKGGSDLAKVAKSTYAYRAVDITASKALEGIRERDLPLDDKVKIIMEELHRSLERCILDNPEHWFWIHRRFKTRPPGHEVDLYEHV